MANNVTVVLEDSDMVDQDNISTTNDKISLERIDLSAEQCSDRAMLLSEFADTFTDLPGTVVSVMFAMETCDSPPIQQRPYSTPTTLKAGVEEEIQWLLNKGMIVPSESLWASHIVTVKKPNRKIRICVDFNRIKKVVTKPLPFLLPRIKEKMEAVVVLVYISTLDLTKDYYQVLMEPEDWVKTTFVCLAGHFEFLCMPIGIRSAPAVFQALMDKVSHCGRAYIDDVVIFSDSWIDNVQHIRQVLSFIKKTELSVNPANCRWGSAKLRFLGHVVGRGHVAIPEDRGKAIRNYVKPTNKRGLQAFVVVVSFYRKFIARLAEQTNILTPATSKSAPPRVVRTLGIEDAFLTICVFLCNQCVLTIPLPSEIYSAVMYTSAWVWEEFCKCTKMVTG